VSESTVDDLSGVANTLLIPLYIRALESQRPDALINDQKSVELVSQMDYDFDRIKLLHLSEANKLVIILRSREFDRYALGYLRRHPNAVVVHIGCGLDVRFERVDNGLVEWFDLDLPDVIELRRKMIGGERERYHLQGCSVLDDAWRDLVSVYRGRPFLFLAEGVFMYLKDAQVKSLVLKLRKGFPGAELIFDCYSPLHVMRSNLQTAWFGLRVHWGIWRGQEVERWADGIHLLDEWGFFDCPEPRLNRIRWMRWVESLARTLRIYQFQLGEQAA
jgi:O-methyltransferase involved in polyketide biosynthesis